MGMDDFFFYKGVQPSHQKPNFAIIQRNKGKIPPQILQCRPVYTLLGRPPASEFPGVPARRHQPCLPAAVALSQRPVEFPAG
jgi:hypothetical protein